MDRIHARRERVRHGRLHLHGRGPLGPPGQGPRARGRRPALRAQPQPRGPARRHQSQALAHGRGQRPVQRRRPRRRHVEAARGIPGILQRPGQRHRRVPDVRFHHDPRADQPLRRHLRRRGRTRWLRDRSADRQRRDRRAPHGADRSRRRGLPVRRAARRRPGLGERAGKRRGPRRLPRRPVDRVERRGSQRGQHGPHGDGDPRDGPAPRRLLDHGSGRPVLLGRRLGARRSTQGPRR